MLRTLALSLCALGLLAVAPEAPQLKGALAKPGKLDATTLKGLPKYRRLVKVATPDGQYRCSMEVEGYALRDVLDRRVIKKQDDGFDRPLDLFITVKGRNGEQALFSHGETFLAGDEGALLVEKARLILPHHHDPLKAGTNDPTVLLNVSGRQKNNLAACAGCHEGPKPPALSLPKGWLLVTPQDGFGGRFVEDIAEITLRQVGTTVKDTRSTSKNAFVEAPMLVGPGGQGALLNVERFQQLPHSALKDATFGLGKGFHGLNTWEGVPLEALIRSLLPPGTDPRKTYVVVTSEDGYRVVYSGSEVFAAAPEKGVLLVERKNGTLLGKGSGRYTTLSRTDFYIDRDVRMVKEIRLEVLR